MTTIQKQIKPTYVYLIQVSEMDLFGIISFVDGSTSLPCHYLKPWHLKIPYY